MADSTNYTERFNVWKEWRKVVGSQIQPLYTRYVALKNKLAVLRGYNDYGEEWRDAYEMDDFEGEVMNIYEEMQPLYKELHAFIRRKLWRVYGEEHIDIKVMILSKFQKLFSTLQGTNSCSSAERYVGTLLEQFE